MNIMTLPKKGLKARPYSMDTNKDNHYSDSTQKGFKDKTI